MDEASDEALLEAWRTGDRAAGSTLCQRLTDPLYRFFRGKVDVGSEDLVQKTLTGLVEGHHRYAGRSTFRGYVFGIAWNVFRGAIRERRSSGEDPDFSSQSLQDLLPSPSSVAAAREQHDRLHRALRRLPVEQQVTLELFYWEQLTGREIADALGVTEGAIRSRLLRGRAALRTLLMGLGESAADADETASTFEGGRAPPS